jgi:hypothetical protein
MQVWQHKASKKHVLVLTPEALLWGSEKEAVIFQEFVFGEGQKPGLGQKWVRDMDSFVKAHMPIGMINTGEQTNRNGHNEQGATGVQPPAATGGDTGDQGLESADDTPVGHNKVCHYGDGEVVDESTVINEQGAK